MDTEVSCTIHFSQNNLALHSLQHYAWQQVGWDQWNIYLSDMVYSFGHLQ